MAYGPLLDGLTWPGSTGRTWLVSGDDLVLWMAPTIALLGENPQRMRQDDPYDEAGATAEDANGDDLTSSIVTDSSAVDPATPGAYMVTYDVTDTYGGTAHVEREVIVIDINTPAVRAATALLLTDGLPDGTQVYHYPADSIKAPAVVIGTMDWTPAVSNSLRAVEWTMQVKLYGNRSMPIYGVIGLETFSVKVAQILAVGSYRVVGFTDDGTETVGGVDYLTGSLEVVFRSKEN